MTTKDKIISILVRNGMFENQAEQVFNLAKSEIESMTPEYQITWDRPANEYGTSLYSVMMMVVNRIALKWIDSNIPSAWFRPMFDPNLKFPEQIENDSSL